MTIPFAMMLLVSVCVCWLGGKLFRRRRFGLRVAAVVCLLAGFAGAVTSGYALWFLNRSQPDPAREKWFEGIAYERIILQSPRLVVVHVVTVDLDTPGIKLIVTPPDAWDVFLPPLKARTTSAFAREQNLQLAVNANFYFPFHANHPLSYYPHTGDPVQVAGFAAAEGRVYHEDPWNGATFYIARDGKVGFEKPPDAIWSAIAGNTFLLRDGRSTGAPTPGEPEIYARTALGLDVTGRRMILAVIEGKQPGRSLGMTIPELAEFMRAHGAHNAINLDGGGSSTLVRETTPGQWNMVNCTSNFKMPWWERPVANHLGIHAPAK